MRGRRGRGRPGMAPRRTAMMARRMTTRMAMMARRRHRRRRRRRVVLVGGLIAVGAYKLSKRDTERVEEYTGKPAEELSDQELDQAMSALDIQADEMTDEDLDYVDEADPPEEDYIEELERLGELRDKGILTDEEFEAQKKQILGL